MCALDVRSRRPVSVPTKTGECADGEGVPRGAPLSTRHCAEADWIEQHDCKPADLVTNMRKHCRLSCSEGGVLRAGLPGTPGAPHDTETPDLQARTRMRM